MEDTNKGGANPASNQSGTNGEGGANPPSETQLTYEQANKFMKDRTHKMFYTEDELNKHNESILNESLNSAKKGFFEKREKNLFELSGIEKQENENYDAYASRVFKSLQNNDASKQIEALNATFESKSNELQEKIKQLQEQNEALNQEKEQAYQRAQEGKALSSLNLDYQGIELEGMQTMVIQDFYKKFQAIDYKGSKAWQNKSNNEILIDNSNQALSLSDAITQHGKSLEGVKLKTQSNSFGVPNGNGSAGMRLTDEQRVSLEQKADRESGSKGYAFNSKEFWEQRQKSGIDLEANYPRFKDAFKTMKLIS